MISDKVRDKIAKVYELVKRGTNGEKEAAQKALDRLVKKYHLDDINTETIKQKEYSFKYTTMIEQWLLLQLLDYFFNKTYTNIFRNTYGVKELVISMDYLDYVKLECAYEYFRKHMKKEFKKVCLPAINRCRTSRTKNKRRAELQHEFFSRYVIVSKLYKEEQLTKKPYSEMSNREFENTQLVRSVKGGQFNQQVNTGLYLEK